MRFIQAERWQRTVALNLARLIDSPEVWREAYENLLTWKGRVTRLAQQNRSRLLVDHTDEQAALIADLHRVQGELSTLVFRENVADRAARDERLAELRQGRNELELQLQRRTRSRNEAPVVFDRFRAALPERAAVVDFFIQGVCALAGTEGGPAAEGGADRAIQAAFEGLEHDPHLTVWITRRDDEAPRQLDLGPVARIEDTVRTFLEILVARGSVTRGARRRRTADSRDVNAELQALIWQPIAEHLGDDVDLVFLSPDGFVGTLPFETLQGEDGRYLIEQRAFVYLQDVSTLANLNAAGANGRTLDSLLSVGGVDFDRRADEAPDPASTGSTVAASDPTTDTSDRPGSTWAFLPATVDESQAVHRKHEAVFLDGRRTVVRGAMATEERFKSYLPGHAILHLATHGFFHPKGLTPTWDASPGGADSDPQIRDTDRRLLGNHPGLLSGLVCAGANTEASDGRDDGYFTAEEVSWLDLSAVRLVVLSACETGLGRAESGEGLIGLRRAFRIAGADCVISSLWSVGDQSTSVLMQSFYTNLLEHRMGTLNALRTAQLEMLANNRRTKDGNALPSTWGAFVVDGDWR